MKARLRKPEFFVIGASRCGTTSLHAALARHPGIFVPVEKSPNFFTAPDMENFPGSTAMEAMKGHTVKTEPEYLALFQSVPAGRLPGEVSPIYMQSVFAAARLARFAPDAKILAILREPVDRAFAHFIGRRRDGLESRSNFADSIAEELAHPTPKDLAFNNYLAIGRYAHYLAPFFAEFPRDRMRILFFDDFVRNPVSVLNDALAFLGVSEVDRQFVVDRKNQSGIVRNPVLRGLWTGSALFRARMRSHLPRGLRDAVGRLFLHSMEQPRLQPEIRRAAQGYFLDDIARLESMTGRDLSAWRELRP
jgi:hypothetical protein